MNNHSELEKKPAGIQHLHSRYETGQAIVIIAMAMVVLLGMLGLAIDGGGLFFLQRDAQNATDAAVLSASYAICTKGDPVAAGLATFAQNGFNNNGFSNKVTVNYPPLSGTAAGDPHYVEVMLEAHKPAYFIQLVYRQPLQVNTYAVGNCIPPFDPSTVPGLWAGSTTCNDTMNWTGSDGTIIGGIFSNNQIKFQGSSIVTSGGPIEAVGSIDGNNVTYAPTYPPTSGVAQKVDPLDLSINLYAPGGDVANIIPPQYYHAIPRLETTGWKANNSVWDPTNGTTIEGLYFIEGDVVVGNGVKVGPKGVTIVATGDIKFSGKTDNPPIRYYEGVMGLTARDVRYPGIIFFSSKIADKCGSNAVSFSEPNGNYHGVIYVPRSGVNISGSSIVFNGSVLAQTIDYSGSQGTLKYDPSLLPPRPPQIQMVE